MWKKITDSKWFYIVVSLLLAFVLWLYVGKEANPSVAAPVRGIKVTVAGLEKLEERGLMVSEGADQTITLDLQAKRNVFNRLDNENITITVDVSNINEPGEVSLDYKITYPLSVYGEVIEERGKRPEKIALTISRWTEKEVPVRAVLTGNVAEDYQQGEFSLAPQTVTVRGREELVEQIDYAQVTVSQEGMTETYRQEMPFVFIDRNGSPLEEEDASQLVKMYAMVNVQQYQIVATGTSVEECEKQYKELLAQNATHQDWCSTTELMEKTANGQDTIFMHPLPADISGLSCPEGEVDNSVFDRYLVPLYKQASYKPYIIAAMIFLAQVKDPVKALMNLDSADNKRKMF